MEERRGGSLAILKLVRERHHLTTASLSDQPQRSLKCLVGHARTTVVAIHE